VRCSSTTPFLNQVAEAGLVSPGDFAHEIRGQLQISLGTGQADMAKIRGQKGQLGTEVNVLFAPQQKPESGKRMPQVMESNAFVARTLNAGTSQYLVEGIAKGSNRIRPPAGAKEKWRLGKAGSEVLDGARAAFNEPRNQVRGKQHHSRFVELGVANM
jgi:hypothetical protein